MNIEYISTNLNKYTFKSKKIKKWVQNNCIGGTLNLFAGKILLNGVDEFRIDIDKEMIADKYMDAYEYVKHCNCRYHTVLLDPPYSYRKSMEFYKGNYTSKFKLIADELARMKVKRVISFGYHSTYMGKKRGYELKKMCVFGHSGAQHCTIAIVEELNI